MISADHYASGFVNVVLFLTTRRVLPIHSVVPRSVSRLFRGPLTVDTRASSYTTGSSITARSSFASDLEKASLSDSASTPYDDPALPRPDAPLSAFASPYTRAAGAFAIGSARSDVDANADVPESGRARSIDISSVRYSESDGDSFVSGPYDRRGDGDGDGDGAIEPFVQRPPLLYPNPRPRLDASGMAVAREPGWGR